MRNRIRIAGVLAPPLPVFNSFKPWSFPPVVYTSCVHRRFSVTGVLCPPQNHTQLALFSLSIGYNIAPREYISTPHSPRNRNIGSLPFRLLTQDAFLHFSLPPLHLRVCSLPRHCSQLPRPCFRCRKHRQCLPGRWQELAPW